jgi:hypothetical protein
MKLWIEKYWGTRYFALYDRDKNDELVASFAYKTGALHVKGLLEEFDEKLRAATNGKGVDGKVKPIS